MEENQQLQMCNRWLQKTKQSINKKENLVRKKEKNTELLHNIKYFTLE